MASSSDEDKLADVASPSAASPLLSSCFPVTTESDTMPDLSRIRKKTFTNWFNVRLQGNSVLETSDAENVKDIATDLRDGLYLRKLVEACAGPENIPLFHMKPVRKQECLENTTAMLQFFKDEGIAIENIGPENVYNGDLNSILHLIEKLVLKYQFKLSCNQTSIKKVMLCWVNVLLPEISVSNFTTDWNSGIALCTLLNRIKPDLCQNFKSLNLDEGEKNCSMAMSLAETHLDIPKLLDLSDFISPMLDEFSVMTYLSYFCASYAETLLTWVKRKLPNFDINNFTTDWNDGVALAALVDSMSPGVFAHYALLMKTLALQNCTNAMDLAEGLFGIKKILDPEEMINPDVHYLIITAYISQFHLAAVANQCKVLDLPSSVMCGQCVKFKVVPKSEKQNIEVIVMHTGIKVVLDIKVDELDQSIEVNFPTAKVGMYEIDVRLNNKSIAEMPKTIKVYDPGKCFFLKPIQSNIVVEETCELQVDTSNAGPGQLKIHCTERELGRSLHVDVERDEHGIYLASFSPNSCGRIDVNVLWEGCHIPGSPFIMPVCDRLEAAFCGEALGLQKSASADNAEFPVDANNDKVIRTYPVENEDNSGIPTVELQSNDKDFLQGTLFAERMVSSEINSEEKGAKVEDSLKASRKFLKARSNGGFQQLHLAALNGQLNRCMFLIRRGANVEAKDRYGRRPLHLAALNGHSDVCDELIKNRASVEAQDNNGWQPLHGSAINGHSDTCTLLIERGADVKAKGNAGLQPLHCAALKDYSDVCDVLIKNRASVEAQDNNGRQPLHWAAFNGHSETCQLLMKRGSSEDAKDNNDNCPLHEAAFNGHTDTCKLLINSGAGIEAQNSKGWQALHKAALNGHYRTCELLINRGASFEAQDSNGWQPLHNAALNGHRATCNLLLTKGANVEAKDSFGWQPLHAAAFKGQSKTCHLLIRKGGSLKAQNIYGRQPLHEAAFNGHSNTCEFLITEGANVESQDIYGLQPLHRSALKGHSNTCELLLRRKASVNAKSHSGSQPLHKAAANGHSDTCDILINSGASVEAKDDNGWLPLHEAAFHGHTDTCSFLIKIGARMDAKDNDGQQALHKAASRDHSETCQFLINGGASVKAKDNSGQEPLHDAALNGHLDVCNILIENEASVEARDSNDSQPLHNAAMKGHTSLCERFIDSGANVFAINSLKRTPLFLSIENRHRPAIELLMKHSEKNGRSYYPDGMSYHGSDVEVVLRNAVENGLFSFVVWLSEKGAKFSVYGDKALIAAAKSNNYKMIELLVNSGASIKRATTTAQRRRYTNVAPVLHKSDSYPLKIFSESENDIYTRVMSEGSAEACFLRLDIVGKDNSGKSSLRKSLTNQRFDKYEPSTLGIEFDSKCEIVVLESCNWKTSLCAVDHLKLFEKALSSEMACQSTSDAMSVIAEETSLERKTRKKGKKSKPVNELSQMTELPPKIKRHEETDNSVQKESQRKESTSEKRKSENTEVALFNEYNASDQKESRLQLSLVDEDSSALTSVGNPVELSRISLKSLAPLNVFNTSLEREQVTKDGVGQLVRTYLEDPGIHSKVKREKYIDILDYGGQDVFYATHYLYLSREAIYFAVFDASIPLENCSVSEFRQVGQKPVRIDVAPGETYYDRLEEWISAVHLMQPPDERTVLYCGRSHYKPPLVFLVGTHKDKALKTPGLLEKQDKYLRERLKGKSFWKHIVEASDECLFFAVDNTKSDPNKPNDEDEEVVRLRLKVETKAKELTGSYRVPIKFLLFERYIREMKLRHSRKVTSIKSLREVAKAIADINQEEEFQLAIRYLSNRAVILYHDLPGPYLNEDTVLDPCWLAGILEKLITVPAINKTPPSLRNDMERSETKGIVTKDLLNYQLRDVESKEFILKLMKYFDLVCNYYKFDNRFEKGDDKAVLLIPEQSVEANLVAEDASLPELAYFIPCLLREKNELESSLLAKECQSLPLLFYSSETRVPPPLFYRLLTQLSRRFPRLPYLNRNVGYFLIYYGHSLEISLLPYSIQFLVFTKNEERPCRQICSIVRGFIYKKVEETKKQGMIGLRLCLGYLHGLDFAEKVTVVDEEKFVSLEGFPDRTIQLFAGEREVSAPLQLAEWFSDLPLQAIKRVDKLEDSLLIQGLLEAPVHRGIVEVAAKLDKDHKLGDNWESLWEKLLKRPMNRDVILSEKEGPTIFILRTWVQQNCERATVSTLITALNEIYRNDAAVALLGYFEGCSSDKTLCASGNSKDFDSFTDSKAKENSSGSFSADSGHVSVQNGSSLIDNSVINIQLGSGDINIISGEKRSGNTDLDEQSTSAARVRKRDTFTTGAIDKSCQRETSPAKKSKN